MTIDRAISGTEIIIVGSGLSGLTVANELMAFGVRDIMVVESGPPEGVRQSSPRNVGTACPAWSARTPPHYEWCRAEIQQGAAQSPTGRGVGGRSLHWHGVLLRIEDYAIDDPCWPARTRARLQGMGEGSGLYDQIEDEIAQWRAATPQSRAAAVKQDAADAAFGELLTAATGSSARPVPQAVRYSASGGPRRVYTPLDRFREQGGEVGGASRLVELSGHMPAIMSDMTAVAVLATAGAASGVLIHDTRLNRYRELHAPTVILAAGTIENTRLVAQLRETGGPVRFDGLNDHLTQGFVARVPGSACHPAVRSGAFALVSRNRRHRCNIFARLHAGDFPGETMLLDVWALGEQTRSSANHVEIGPMDGGSGRPWSTVVTAGLSADDVRVLEGERELLAGVWEGLAAALGIHGETLRFGDFFAGAQPFQAARHQAVSAPVGRPLTYAWPLGAGDHEGGTLPLGSLLDDAGAVREVDGIFVTGPSTFPRAGAANPSLTTLALARLTAQAVRGDSA